MRFPFPQFLPAIAAAAWLAACGDGPPHSQVAPVSGPNLVLISIDSLRADRLGCYGAERDTSPAIDALSAEGARFETVVAPTSWTLPSHVTLFSGVSSRAHGVSRDDRAAGPGLPMLAEILRDAGWETAGLWSGP